MATKAPPLGSYPGGTLAFYDKNLGCWHIAKPHSIMYSTVTMVATHYFNGSFWEPIHESK